MGAVDGRGMCQDRHPVVHVDTHHTPELCTAGMVYSGSDSTAMFAAADANDGDASSWWTRRRCA